MPRIIFILILVIFNSMAQAESQKRLTLSLQEAINLAIRKNPNVEQAQLHHILQKFNLDVEQWQFKPQYLLQATTSTTRNYSITRNGYVTKNVTGIAPEVSLLTPIGTRLNLAATNNVSSHYNPGVSLQIIQPLIRGFGRPIIETALYNARDDELISRLNIENALRNSVTGVINAYLDVIAAKNVLMIDEQALQRTQLSINQTKIFIIGGHKAENELIISQADLANIKTKIEIDKNNLDQMRYALLASIGINPNTKIMISDLNILELIKKYHIPSLIESKKMILSNDIQYQMDKIVIEGAMKRNLLQAIDSNRVQLDLTINTTTGNSTGGGKNSGLNSIINGVNETNSAILNLSVPIDNRLAKNAIVNAKIALKEAYISLREEKWNKETNIINEWHSVYSTERTLALSENTEVLQTQAYDIVYKKYAHGLIDSLELQSAQQQLQNVQQSVLIERINYLKTLSKFDLLLGRTLKTWNINVRYA